MGVGEIQLPINLSNGILYKSGHWYIIQTYIDRFGNIAQKP